MTKSQRGGVFEIKGRWFLLIMTPDAHVKLTNQIARMVVRTLSYRPPHTDLSKLTGKSLDRTQYFRKL